MSVLGFGRLLAVTTSFGIGGRALLAEDDILADAEDSSPTFARDGTMLLQTVFSLSLGRPIHSTNVTGDATDLATAKAATRHGVAAAGEAEAAAAGASLSAGVPRPGATEVVAGELLAATRVPTKSMVTHPSSGATAVEAVVAIQEEPSSLFWTARVVPLARQLLLGFDFAAFVKVLCIIGNIIFQVSPLPQVKRWQNTGCGTSEDAAPYVSIAFAGCQWCFYGSFAFFVTGRRGFLVLVHSNCLGAFLGIYYVFSFSKYCHHAALLEQLRRYMTVGAALVLFQFASIAALHAERALFISGLVSSFCSVMTASSLLVALPVVIRTRDSTSIPGPVVVASLLSAISWCACGWLLNDPLVMGPNIWGVLCATTCLIVKYEYSSSVEAKSGGEKSTVKVASFVGGSHGRPESAPRESIEPSETPALCKELGPTEKVSRCQKLTPGVKMPEDAGVKMCESASTGGTC